MKIQPSSLYNDFGRVIVNFEHANVVIGLVEIFQWMLLDLSIKNASVGFWQRFKRPLSEESLHNNVNNYQCTVGS